MQPVAMGSEKKDKSEDINILNVFIRVYTNKHDIYNIYTIDV